MKKMSIGKRQGGAVAIMVGISMFMLMAFLGLVLDLGPLYVGKTELQNAADAAALSGAKELKGDLDGISKAEVAAIDTFDQQNFKVPPWVDDDFAKPATTDRINEDNIWVGNCPDDDCMVPIADIGTDAEAADKTFLKVDSGKRQIHAWIMSIFGQNMTSTFGLAVAGRYVTPITPLGVCELRTQREAWVTYDTVTGNQYLVEFGYMRGVSYNLQRINSSLSGLGPGTSLYLHPTATDEASCNSSEGNANFFVPFLCTGRSAISGAAGSLVFTNTGVAAQPSVSALNTRFDQYGPPLDPSLDHTVCTPDANRKPYAPAFSPNWWDINPVLPFAEPEIGIEQMVNVGEDNENDGLDEDDGLSGWLAGDSPAGGGIRDPLPPVLVAKMEKNNGTGGCGGNCSDDYGVLWSYNRPVRGVGNAESGSFATSDWSALYPSGITSSAYVEPSPYRFGLTQGSGPYFDPPTHPASTAAEPRRILNVVIVDCSSAGGVCRPLPVRGVGRFFMQLPADNSAWVAGEFAGLVPESALLSDIRLYR